MRNVGGLSLCSTRLMPEFTCGVVQIINTELFKCLKQTHGMSYQRFMLSKLVPVVGNVCEPNLGMEIELFEKVRNEVDVIVNSAASTTFDERYSS